MHMINDRTLRTQKDNITTAVFITNEIDSTAIPIPGDDSLVMYTDVPRTVAAQLADDCLLLVQQWLDTLQQPADLSDSDFATFVHYAMSFFLHSGKLWRKDSQGCHKIVAEPSVRLTILSIS
jgi:hypothetical protein